MNTVKVGLELLNSVETTKRSSNFHITYCVFTLVQIFNKNPVNFHFFLQQIASSMKSRLLINASVNDDISQNEAATGGDSDFQIQQQQNQLKQHLEFERGMQLEREQRVHQIEAVILNVHDIMKTLNTLVHEQSHIVGKFKMHFLNFLFPMSQNASYRFT